MNSPENKNIYRFMDQRPQLGARVFIDPRASVTGSVLLGDDVSVWPMSVIRGDVNRITIGARSNIQDGCVLHVTHEGSRQARDLTESEIRNQAYSAQHYVRLKDLYREEQG
jgi:carbonic anhydrase/acetyltransferase-like protein (isoleucine patch superfamily)